MTNCQVCRGFLGPLTDDPDEQEQQRHALCSWMRQEDWEALRPWFQGGMPGGMMAPD